MHQYILLISVILLILLAVAMNSLMSCKEVSGDAEHCEMEEKKRSSAKWALGLSLLVVILAVLYSGWYVLVPSSSRKSASDYLREKWQSHRYGQE